MVKSNFPDKYQDLLDAEIWDFIEKTISHYPDDAKDRSISEQRLFYNSLCESYFCGYPDGVTSKDEKIESTNYELPIRNYVYSGGNSVAHIVYYHGGGFVLGDLESHDDVCAELCSQTGFGVTSVDYRLAPEYTWPSDLDDALASFRYASTTFDVPIVVVGDSAGGNLAAAVCHSTRKESIRPIGQVLIYPTLGNEFSKGSFIEHCDAPILSKEQMDFFKIMRTGGNQEYLQEELCFPLCASSFSDLPPCVSLSAQCDPLRDDSRDYCRAISDSGGKSKWIDEAGLVHGYLRARHCSQKAKDSFARIVSATDALGRGNWHFD